MANNFLTDDIIVKDALRLLKNELVLAPLVYQDYKRRFNKKGDNIRLELPYRTKAADGPTLQVQPMVDQNTNLTIDRQKHFGIEFSQTDRTLSIQMFRERYLRSGIVQIANSIDRSIAVAIKTQSFWYSGVPGTVPGSYSAFSGSRALQTKHAVPDDGMRRAVTNPITCSVLSNEVKDLFNEKMVKDAYVKGYYGDVAGYSMHESNNLPTHTVGDYGGTPLINGASQTGDSLVTDGWTASTQVLNAGDIIRISGVYGINPQNYENSGYLQSFVVQQDVVSDGAGNATIVVGPALNDGTLTTTNPNGQTVSLTAYQNVTNAPADNAAIEVIGAANTTYNQDLLFHREACALAMIDIEEPESAVVAERARDDQAGLSMLMTAGYDINNFRQVYRIDALWGVRCIYPELSLRMWGSSPETF